MGDYSKRVPTLGDWLLYSVVPYYPCITTVAPFPSKKTRFTTDLVDRVLKGDRVLRYVRVCFTKSREHTPFRF